MAIRTVVSRPCRSGQPGGSGPTDRPGQSNRPSRPERARPPGLLPAAAPAAASVVLVALSVLLAALSVAGCAATKPTTLGKMTRPGVALTAVVLDLADGREPTRVTDEHVLTLFRNLLKEGEQAAPVTEALPTDRGYVTFELSSAAGPWEVGPLSFVLGMRPDPEAPSSIQFPEGWYSFPPQLAQLVSGLVRFGNPGGPVDSEDAAFMSRYGLEPAFGISRLEVTLPTALVYRPGDFPTAVYWAYGNELSRDAGVGFDRDLGQAAEVRLYKVLCAPTWPGGSGRPAQAWLPDRAVIVRCGERIVGAWVDQVGGLGRSFKGRSAEEITGLTWDAWVRKLTDPADPTERGLDALSPEQVLGAFADALSAHDYKRVRQLYTRRYLVAEMLSGAAPDELYPSGFDDRGLETIQAASVVSIKEVEPPQAEPPGGAPEGTPKATPEGTREQTREFLVRLRLKVKGDVAWGDGINERFFVLHRETEGGWRIDSIATSP